MDNLDEFKPDGELLEELNKVSQMMGDHVSIIQASGGNTSLKFKKVFSIKGVNKFNVIPGEAKTKNNNFIKRLITKNG